MFGTRRLRSHSFCRLTSFVILALLLTACAAQGPADDNGSSVNTSSGGAVSSSAAPASPEPSESKEPSLWLSAMQHPETELYGYVNKEGGWVIQPQFTQADGFTRNGLAAVRVGPVDGDPSGGNTVLFDAIINTDGTFVAGPFENILIQSSCGYAYDLIPAIPKGFTTEAKYWGYVTRTGELAIPYSFQKVSCFYEGEVAAVRYSNGGCIFINNQGGEAEGFPWFSCSNYPPNFSIEGEVGVHDQSSGEWILVNSQGETVFQVQLPNGIESVRLQDLQRYGVAAASLVDGTAGLVDKSGRWITEPFDGYILRGDTADRWLSYVSYPENPGLHYGYLDAQGAWAIPPQFTDAGLFREGKAAIYTYVEGVGPSWGFIDTMGDWVIEPQFKDCHYFDDGEAWATADGTLWGRIDDTGAWIQQPWFFGTYGLPAFYPID
ncbi:MAG: WG repeat-containing protein [Propionibacteriaceae bacterium]|jgi:hypothetical protein|nr:WG repeat-containing protein [Propionibacteriaceae bacterium]